MVCAARSAQPKVAVREFQPWEAPLMRLSFLGKLAAGAMLSTMSAFPALALTDPNDPYVYMEEIEGARAMAFARAENDRSLPLLQNDPRYSKLYADALTIATAKDRIPGVGFRSEEHTSELQSQSNLV